MAHTGESGPPAWVPAYVGSVHRRGSATDEDLRSGRAWQELLERLRKAGEVLVSDRALGPGTEPGTDLEQLAGYRHLLVLLGLGIDEALRPSDPYDPYISAGNVDTVLKWGMDCPDAAYKGAAIRGDATYRISGNRGTVRYLGFQVMSGMEASANVVADDLDLAPNGDFELLLTPERRPGNWMRLSPGASSLIVRQFFYDWEREEPAQLGIECLDAPRRHEEAVPTPAGLARQLVALGEFVGASLEFWLDVEEGGRAQGLNTFREPTARTDLGGAAENVTVWGYWDLEPDQALVIEVPLPGALYWSVALGNHWWESIDYVDHQSSLNGHQAWVDSDGVFRAVASQRDPGIANWLDTAGFTRGPMIFRWVRASDAPVPSTRVIAFDEVEQALPPGTLRADAESRREAIARRRAGVRRRFPR